MTLDEAIVLLSGCTRDELRDHTFGDAEIYWVKDDVEVADGYWGPSAREVHIGDTVFVEGDAMRLFDCGALGTIESNNDSGGRDDE